MSLGKIAAGMMAGFCLGAGLMMRPETARAIRKEAAMIRRAVAKW